MKTAVDTNVLLDILTGDPSFAASSRQTLSKALSSGPVVICQVVFAELAAGFADPKQPVEFLFDLQIRIEAPSHEAILGAAAAWRDYALRRGNDVQCPNCGHRASVSCPACHARLVWRQHVIADFLVGGHAEHQADQLLTRDRGYYRTYFKSLRLVDSGETRPKG